MLVGATREADKTEVVGTPGGNRAGARGASCTKMELKLVGVVQYEGVGKRDPCTSSEVSTVRVIVGY